MIWIHVKKLIQGVELCSVRTVCHTVHYIYSYSFFAGKYRAGGQ